jgi:hypothetical protein
MKRLTFALVLLGLTVGVAAQERIPERVRRGQPAGGAFINDYAHYESLADLAQRGDLIVRGLINEANSHLTKDETSIETDYTVLVLDQLFARGTIKHGQTIVVTREGGTVTVEGKKVTVTENAFKPFEIGDEYVFFLHLRPDTHYGLVAGPQAVFKNVGGEVEQVGYGIESWRGRSHVPMGLFLQELNDAIGHGQGRGK